MTAARKCPALSPAAVREATHGTGRTIAYRVFADLALPDDVPIPPVASVAPPTLMQRRQRRLARR
jgi:hypothetical protein